MEQAVTDSVVTAAQPPPKPKRILLKWSLVATALFFIYLIWELGSGFIAGAELSDSAVRRFHSLVDSTNYEELLRESDKDFQRAESHAELLKLLGGVHSKLGASRDSTRTYTGVTFTTSGAFVKVATRPHLNEGRQPKYLYGGRRWTADLAFMATTFNQTLFSRNDTYSRSAKDSP